MIPLHVLSKLGKYEVEIGGVKIKTSIVDDYSLVDSNISELRSLIQHPSSIVGVDVKFHIDDQNKKDQAAKLLILCVANRCLVIQLDQEDKFPKSLKKLFADGSICFVGVGVDEKVTSDNLCNTRNSVECIASSVEVGDLAARVLKKPSLIKCGLEDLAREVGLNSMELATGSKGATGSSPDWNARVFSEEEIKVAIHEAYTCYCIGNHLLGMLDL
ncbi:hypothetical protein ACOSQ2_009054 [Xanthoceras sorbifolium]